MPVRTASQPSLWNACILSSARDAQPEKPAGLFPPCRMPRSGAMDAWLMSPARIIANTKFGLRTMKSLRKTALMASALLVTVPFDVLMGQQPQPSTGTTSPGQDAQSSPQQSGGQTTIKVPVNPGLFSVDAKDGAGRLVPRVPHHEL